MENILQALIALNDARTFQIAKAVASSERWVSLWEIAFRYLASIKNQDVEDFFVDFLINDDKQRPEITKIVDNYFKDYV